MATEVRTEGDAEDRRTTRVGVEEALRIQIAEFRKSNALSYDALAKLMEAEGYAIHASQIQKTETGERQKITVNELIAYSRVFGVSVTYLLEVIDPEAAELSPKDRASATNVLNEGAGQLNRYAAELRRLADSLEKDAATMTRHATGFSITKGTSNG